MRLTVGAAASITFWPVAMLPVTDTMATLGWLISAWPTVGPRPATILTTPSGKMPAMVLASLSVESGVISDGLSTMVLPPASAGASFQIAIISG